MRKRISSNRAGSCPTRYCFIARKTASADSPPPPISPSPISPVSVSISTIVRTKRPQWHPLAWRRGASRGTVTVVARMSAIRISFYLTTNSGIHACHACDLLGLGFHHGDTETRRKTASKSAAEATEGVMTKSCMRSLILLGGMVLIQPQGGFAQAPPSAAVRAKQAQIAENPNSATAYINLATAENNEN